MRLYLIDPWKYLREYLPTSNAYWALGTSGLNSINFGTVAGTKYLWAALDPCQRSRLGSVRTENILSESWDSAQGWKFAVF